MEELKSAIGRIESESDSDEPGDAGEPSVLKLMVEKEEDIKNTVSLLKRGIAESSAMETTSVSSARESNEAEFAGLNNFLTDQGVKSIVRSIAGENLTNLIDRTIGEINSTASVQEKHKALSNGIEQIQSKLRQKDQSLKNPDDPRLGLALSLLGLKNRLI